MKIVIPSSNGKLCAHFGHCEYFTVVDVNEKNNEILNINSVIPEDGISCQSANWISQQGADVVLAGGMGSRPLQIFSENNIKVVAGCPEIAVEEITKAYLTNTLSTGENSCAGGHHHCAGHHEGHSCHH